MKRDVSDFLIDYMQVIHKKIFKGIKPDYTRHQMRLLHNLEMHGEHAMKYFGQKMMISKPNMTTLVDRLVEDDLIERIPDENDRRKINIRLSSNGKEVLKKQKEIFKQGIEDKLSVLTKEDIELLSSSFKNIKEVFDKLEG